MDYFLYISDSKVDMLLPQIPQKTRIKLAAEIGVNVGVLNIKLKSESEIRPSENRIARLKAVVNYIIRQSKNLGTLDEPNSWIGDTECSGYIFTGQRSSCFFHW